MEFKTKVQPVGSLNSCCTSESRSGYFFTIMDRGSHRTPNVLSHSQLTNVGMDYPLTVS